MSDNLTLDIINRHLETPLLLQQLTDDTHQAIQRYLRDAAEEIEEVNSMIYKETQEEFESLREQIESAHKDSYRDGLNDAMNALYDLMESCQDDGEYTYTDPAELLDILVMYIREGGEERERFTQSLEQEKMNRRINERKVVRHG